MSRCSFNSKDSFDWLFSEDGVSESVSHVGELLLVGPLDVVLASLIMVVVISGGSVLESLKMIELLSLGEPGPGGLSPSVIELKEHVVQVLVPISGGLDLVVVRRDVADFVQVLRSDLADVQIDQVTVVSIDLGELLLVEVLGIEESLHMHVLVRKND